MKYLYVLGCEAVSLASSSRHANVIKIYKYCQNTTDLLYSTTFGLHVSTP